VNSFRLSEQAEQDLENLWVYLANRDEIAADRQVAQLLDRFPMLAQFPNMGRQRDDLLAGLRSFPVKPYVVFYTIQPNGIEIVRVLHQSQDVEGRFS
jgi:toxin ParE1/3/4